MALDIGPERGGNLHSMLWQVSLYGEEIKWKTREMMGRSSNFWGGGVLCLFCLGSLKGAETQEMDPDWVHSCNCWWANCSLSLSPIHLHFLPITENYLCSQLDMRVNPFWLSWQYCEQIPNRRVKKPKQACSKNVSSSITVSLIHKKFAIVSQIKCGKFFFFLKSKTFLMFLCLTMIKIFLPVWWVKLNNINSQGLVNMETHKTTLKGQKILTHERRTILELIAVNLYVNTFNQCSAFCSFTCGEETMPKHKPFHKCHISGILMERPHKHLLKVYEVSWFEIQLVVNKPYGSHHFLCERCLHILTFHTKLLSPTIKNCKVVGYSVILFNAFLNI